MIKAIGPNRTITTYFLLLYIAVVAITGSFMPSLPVSEMRTIALSFIAIVSYALLYLLPAFFLTKILSVLLRVQSRSATWKTLVCYSTACFTGTATVLFLLADRLLFSLYGYHFNAFVWNLVTTPGGIEALGSTSETQFTATLGVMLILLVNALVLWALNRWRGMGDAVYRRRPVVYAVFALLALLLVIEEGAYAYASYTHDEPILMAASIIPLHLNSSATKLFKAVGVERPLAQERVRISHGEIHYPVNPVQVKSLEKYPNIVWLTAESFRWDLLNPEITPNLWRFSEKAVRFNQHYSGGNRTRMGMFSMFYGLYGSYWYGFEEQKVRPVMMQQIADNNYQMAIHTSQSFSYPELKDTVFTQIPAANLHELKEGPSWQRDTQNISDINHFIETRNPAQPFFTFMFFEATHAPYNFPESAVIREDYVRQVNYLQLNNLTGNIKQLHNRYINAAHHVDAEVGRILQLLEDEQLLDNTIVIFTGDHGEEFMEHGNWGHGHNQIFPEQQIRVPLVLWIPGVEPQHIDFPTSHAQLPATLLPYLGVTSPALDYSSAKELFAGPQTYRVVGNYNYLSVIDDESKITFPYTSADYFHYSFSDSQDNLLPVQQQQQLLARNQMRLYEIETECNRFISKKATSVAKK